MSHWNSIAGAVRRTWSRWEDMSCMISCREQGSSSLGQCSARCAYTRFWKSPLTLGTEGTCACVSFSCSLVPIWITTVFWHITCAQELFVECSEKAKCYDVHECMTHWAGLEKGIGKPRAQTWFKSRPGCCLLCGHGLFTSVSFTFLNSPCIIAYYRFQGWGRRHLWGAVYSACHSSSTYSHRNSCHSGVPAMY